MWRRGVRHRVEYGAVLFLAFLARALPLGWGLAVGAGLGRFAFDVLRVRRRVTLENLRLALGDRTTEAERVRIGRSSYANFGRLLIEFARFPKLRPETLRDRVTCRGLDRVDAALARGKGAIVLSPHFGNWELLGVSFRLLGYPMNFLVGEQHNQAVNDLMNRLRAGTGVGIIPRGYTIRGVIEVLRRNELVALLGDQDARRHGVFVDFFGRPASTPKGPASFAQKTGAPILPAFMVRKEGGMHELVIEAPIEPVATGDRDEDIRSLTQAHVRVLEAYIREYPDHWFWPHRRWKSRPPAGGERLPTPPA
jgi:KDO2-lipid IV(A) lauroyltransferase